MIYVFLILLLSSCSTVKDVQKERSVIRLDSIAFERNLLMRDRQILEIVEVTRKYDTQKEGNPLKEEKEVKKILSNNKEVASKEEAVQTVKHGEKSEVKKEIKTKAFDFGIIKTYLMLGALIALVSIIMKFRKKGQ